MSNPRQWQPGPHESPCRAANTRTLTRQPFGRNLAPHPNFPAQSCRWESALVIVNKSAPLFRRFRVFPPENQSSWLDPFHKADLSSVRSNCPVRNTQRPMSRTSPKLQTGKAKVSENGIGEPLVFGCGILLGRGSPLYSKPCLECCIRTESGACYRSAD